MDAAVICRVAPFHPPVWKGTPETKEGAQRASTCHVLRLCSSAEPLVPPVTLYWS